MIEMVVYGIFFLLMCTVGYLTLNVLHKKHQAKHRPDKWKPTGPIAFRYYVDKKEMEEKDG